MAVGISVSVESGRIARSRIAFGGMAGTPMRASSAEAAISGQPWSEDTFDAAAESLTQDFRPLSDWRASAEYRMLSAQNLLRRFFLEHDTAEGAAAHWWRSKEAMMKDTTIISGGAHQNHIHDSAEKHVTGRAEYTDDIAQPEGTLHAYLGVSDVLMPNS